ncbi:beta-nerve growth factor [Fowlpox virus]|uniref:Beta-nerve growth factor n=1 Tax=Fowlpox virus TaxID=10261 RepID=A0A7G0X7V0_FOWPV|nr:beta-nerve growth factor [Fowlpox virus]UQT20367.1 beta-nerve growth factor [Fowlpox virus]UQT20608.1 beta-nerve growth factor [Fowlpox virus]URH24791.1 beta-nerve growth factor [Fowlpox virus]URH25050.1 beta-nerve growth factor [Fowlpox virus]
MAYHTRPCSFRRLIFICVLGIVCKGSLLQFTNPYLINDKLDTSKVVFSTRTPNIEHRGKRSIDELLSVGNTSEGIYLSCESSSTWVANKTTVFDHRGNKLELLDQIVHNKQVYYQYLFETKCKEYPAISGCLGIDTRFWSSYCSTSHSFVNSIVIKNGMPSWEYIRIGTSCVCVVQLKCKANVALI